MTPVLVTPEQAVAAAWRDLEKARKTLRCQISLPGDDPDKSPLLEFVRQCWHVLEPSKPLVEGWILTAMCSALEAVTDGRIKRLLINVPPGCMKSLLVNVIWPAWEWGPRNLRSHRFISASYEKGLATRHVVRCRDLICSEWYQERWPMALKDDEDQKTYYVNDGTGWRYASSVGGALTGYRGDRNIVDDPHDVNRAESDAERESACQWFAETLSTRFNDEKTGALVVVMQRLHTRDVSGLILKNFAANYVHLCLPMEFEVANRCVVDVPGFKFADPRTEEGELLWPARFSREGVDLLKQELSAHGGSYAVAGQLQQRPVSRGGGMFPRKHATFVDRPVQGGVHTRGWDLAATKDRGAAATAGVKLCKFGKQLYVEDVVWLQGTASEVEAAILAAARQDGTGCRISVPQDPGQAGKAQKMALVAMLGGYDAHATPETGSKEDRAIPISAQWEAGNVVLVRGPWNDRFLAELEMFPGGERKDQVDAFSRAYADILLSTAGSEVGLIPGVLYTYDRMSE